MGVSNYDYTRCHGPSTDPGNSNTSSCGHSVGFTTETFRTNRLFVILNIRGIARYSDRICRGGHFPVDSPLFLLYNPYNTRRGGERIRRDAHETTAKGCLMTTRFATRLKRLRIQKGLGLREFCLGNGFDPGNYSRLERGHFPPPRNETLQRYARALGLKEGSTEWIELFDLAAAERGEIPADILSDEEVVQKLPVLFRTLRAKPLTAEQLDKLIERVRRS